MDELKKALSFETLTKNQTYAGIARQAGISINTLTSIRRDPGRSSFNTIREVAKAAGYRIKVSLEKIEDQSKEVS
jgi:DNA-binding phage protein